MPVIFEHRPHPRIAERKKTRPAKTRDEHVGINGKIALALTTAVGTMWCAYAFALLALTVVPQAVVADLRKSPGSISETPQADEPRTGRTSLAA